MSRPIRRPRWARMAVILTLIALASAIGRGIWANGVFSTVTPGFGGTCKVVATVPGVQDMEIADGVAFVAVASARGPGPQDGIYALKLDGGHLTRLAGTPKDFHPRGIGLAHSPDGKSLFVMAVNKRSQGGFAIDSFEITNPQAAPALVAEGTVQGGLLINPQDVVPVSPTNFYVANGTAGTNPLLHGLQTYGLIPGGNVLYFNGMSFSVATDGLYGTRSLVMTRDGSHVIVGGLLSRSLESFTRNAFTGALTDAGSLTLDAGPEKLALDSEGQVWVAGHANLVDWRDFAAHPASRSASQVFRVLVNGGVPQQAAQVYGNAGSEIAGASVAAPWGNHLLIGSSLDGRLLDCTAN